jgi:hypothetical protein
MNIICSNITQMDSCAEILDLNSKFGKDCDDHVKLILQCTQMDSYVEI